MYSGNWEVTGMTRNKIFAKLRRKNKGQYGILAFCIFLSVLLLTGAAAALGLLGAIPLSWLIWKLFESFLVSTEEMEYHFGIGGLLVGLVFAIILAILLGAAGRKFVKKTNVMDILRTQHQPEMVKKIPAWTFYVWG